MFTVTVTFITISLSQERGLETKGIKPDLIARLEQALEEEAKDEEKDEDEEEKDEDDVEMVEPEEEDQLEKEKTPSAPIAIDDLRYVEASVPD